jgi:hypothetical protein
MNIHDIPLIKITESGNFFPIKSPCAIEEKKWQCELLKKLVGITDFTNTFCF